MEEKETIFCVACCKYLPPENFTRDKDKDICDGCCEDGENFTKWIKNQKVG